MWDIAIIGAGPAGCAAAIELALAGARVGLLEKAAFPRDKLCGEFLSPEVAQILDELGLGRQFRALQPAPIERAVVVTPSGARLEFPFPAPAWGLSRLRLDHLLADATQQSGAQLLEKTEIAKVWDRHSCAVPTLLTRLPWSLFHGEQATKQKMQGPSSWNGTCLSLEARDGRQFGARAVLLAAGRHSLLQPVRTPRFASRAYFGFKAHYEGECDGRVELYFFKGGYCGLAPVEGGRVNLCCLLEKRLLRGNEAEQVLARVAPLATRLAGLRRSEPFLHTGPVAMGWGRPPPGMLPAGDAALFVDPFTGDGISLALQTGRLAARHLLGNAPRLAKYEEDYLKDLRRRFGRQLRAARLLRAAASRPWLERPLVRLFSSSALRRAAFLATRDLGRPRVIP